MADDETYEQELQVGNLFRAIASGFKRLEKLADATKIQGEVRDLTSKLQEAKTCACRHSPASSLPTWTSCTARSPSVAF